MSDGSNKIFKIDAASLELVETIKVINEFGFEQHRINELEFVNGYIWANIFLENFIVKIDPSQGKIVKTYDMKSLLDAEFRLVEKLGEWNYDYGNNVLNGIAYDGLEDVFYLTGKRWRMMFKLKIY